MIQYLPIDQSHPTTAIIGNYPVLKNHHTRTREKSYNLWSRWTKNQLEIMKISHNKSLQHPLVLVSPVTHWPTNPPPRHQEIGEIPQWRLGCQVQGLRLRTQLLEFWAAWTWLGMFFSTRNCTNCTCKTCINNMSTYEILMQIDIIVDYYIVI